MPPPIIPDAGKVGFMGAIMDAVANGHNSAKVHLFENNYTPVVGSIIADFVECVAGGLGSQPTPPVTNQGVATGGPDNWLFDPIVFTATGTFLPALVYGFWVDYIDPYTGNPTILWAQRFDTPVSCVNAGDTVPFQPNLAGTQC